jgi:hypothetical protein
MEMLSSKKFNQILIILWALAITEAVATDEAVVHPDTTPAWAAASRTTDNRWAISQHLSSVLAQA